MIWLRTFCGALPSDGSSILSGHAGLDFRLRLIALLLVATLAFVAIAPDVDLEPALSRLPCWLLKLSVVHLGHTVPDLQTASMLALAVEISRPGTQACIIALNCSRLC